MQLLVVNLCYHLSINWRRDLNEELTHLGNCTMHWTKTTVILYLIFLTRTKQISNLDYTSGERERREQGRKKNSDLILSYSNFWQGNTVIKISKSDLGTQTSYFREADF